MNTETDLKWIHAEIDKVNDAAFIDKLRRLLESFHKTENQTDYDADIERALGNMAERNYFTEEQAKNSAKKWGRK
ncbi:MAG: hypothetical protein PSV16_07390 [Flavobacterium sp.]|nr:hypothetical protein [Flavobacterium sp.]